LRAAGAANGKHHDQKYRNLKNSPEVLPESVVLNIHLHDVISFVGSSKTRGRRRRNAPNSDSSMAANRRMGG
jgi:hypothetical protein